MKTPKTKFKSRQRRLKFRSKRSEDPLTLNSYIKVPIKPDVGSFRSITYLEFCDLY